MPEDPKPTPLAAANEIDRICDRFEDAWRLGKKPRIEDFLAQCDEPHRAALLPALLLVELELLKPSGHPIDEESYRRRFPERVEVVSKAFADLKRIETPSESAAVDTSAIADRETLPPDAEVVGVAGTLDRQSVQDDPQLPTKFGRYRVEKLLGEGAMGSVHLAHDTQLNRKVALKIPKFRRGDSAELIERFCREARAAANLRNASICPIYDVGEIDGMRYISMAYIAGRPLSNYTRGGSFLRQRHAAMLVRKIALALQDAHDNGVVHRDLKPSNIMIDKKNRPIITDFGLACQIDQQESPRLTQEGAIVGSPAYMSPEQVEGHRNLIGPACDIYSLGAILYELLTGQTPFEGSIAFVIGQIVSAEPSRPSELRPSLDRDLETICLKMLEKTIEDRYASMNEVTQALTEYLQSSQNADDTVPADPPSKSPATKPKAELPQGPATPPPLAEQAVQKAGPTRARRAESCKTGQGSGVSRWPFRSTSGAVLTAVVMFALMAAAITFYLRSDGQTVKIEIDDSVRADGIVVSIDGDRIDVAGIGVTITLKAGPHDLEVKRGDVVVETRKFEIVKGEDTLLRITLPETADPSTVAARTSPETAPPTTRTPLPDGPTSQTGVWKDLTAFPSHTDEHRQDGDGGGWFGVNEIPDVQLPEQASVAERIKLHSRKEKWIFTYPPSRLRKLRQQPTEIVYQFTKPVYGFQATLAVLNSEAAARASVEIFADGKLMAAHEDVSPESKPIHHVKANGLTTLRILTRGLTPEGGDWILIADPEVLVGASGSAPRTALTDGQNTDWQTIFNGRDLSGWRVLLPALDDSAQRKPKSELDFEGLQLRPVGDFRGWNVRDELLVFEGLQDICLAYDKVLKDFEVSMEIRLTPGAYFQFVFRTKLSEGRQGRVQGALQTRLLDEKSNRTKPPNGEAAACMLLCRRSSTRFVLWDSGIRC